MRRNTFGEMLLVLLVTLLLSGVAAKDALAAVAMFDSLGRLANPDEVFRHYNPPPKGQENAPIPKIDAYDKDGCTPLRHAIWVDEDAEAVRLLKQKANPNARDAYGDTPLEAAARKGNLKMAALLVKYGAKASQGYPLFFAGLAEENSAEMTAFLQKHGAIDKGNPPRRQLRPRVVGRKDALLLDQVIAEEKKTGVPQSSIPVAVLLGRSQEEIAALIKRGSDINEIHPACGTALHQAMFQGRDTELFKFLLQSGADPNLVSPYPGSPLEEAISAGKEELVCLLLEAGASIKNPDGKKMKSRGIR